MHIATLHGLKLLFSWELGMQIGYTIALDALASHIKQGPQRQEGGGRGGMDVALLKKTYQLPQSSELMLSVCPIISDPYPRLNRELTTLNCAELRAAVIVFEGME